MPETREQIKQEASMQGQQIKQRLHQQQWSTDEALTILAADFAQLSLSVQPPRRGRGPRTRRDLRADVLEGYLSQLL